MHEQHVRYGESQQDGSIPVETAEQRTEELLDGKTESSHRHSVNLKPALQDNGRSHRYRYG